MPVRGSTASFARPLDPHSGAWFGCDITDPRFCLNRPLRVEVGAAGHLRRVSGCGSVAETIPASIR